MVKLRKAFSLNIHLHIRQGMLQRLWDKYVPTESPEYGQIQLVYLGEQARGGQVQSGQANLLISLVLKNRIMQMGLEKCPVKTAYVREQMENSLQRMERYYLTQLKCCNFVMYRKAERFMSLLEQAETGRNRYQKWQKESGYMERQRENYRMFSRFAVNIREFLTEHSQQTMRVQERELLHLLSKKEYRKFCRLCRLESDQEFVGGQNVKWKKNKDKMFHSIERLETTKIRRLWAQMEHLEAQGGNVDTVLMHKLMQIRQQYRREIVRGFWEHVLSVLDNEEFQAAADMAEISPKVLKRQLVEEEHRFEVGDMQFSEEGRVQMQEEKSAYPSEEGRAYLSGQSVYELLEHIESVLENEKSRIEQQEARMFTSYQEIYQEAFVSVWRESHLEEKAARKMLGNIYQMEEEKKEEFVEELAERILLRQQVHITDAGNPRSNFSYTEREIDGLISYIAYVIEKKEKLEAVVTEDTAERTFVHTTELADREAEELFLQIASVIEQKKSTNTDRYAEEEVQEILSYIADKREQDKYPEYAQTIFKVTENMHHSADGQEERRMLLYLHNLEAEKRTEFIEKLAERVLLQQGAQVSEERNFHKIVDTEEKNLRETNVIKEELSHRVVDIKEEAARIFGYTGEQIEGLLSYVAYVAENKKKTGEMISRVSEVAERRTEEIYETGEVQSTEEIYATGEVQAIEEIYETGEVQATEEIYETELADREAEELFLQIASVIEQKKSINTDRFAEGEIEEIFSYIMDKREQDKYLEYEQTVFKVTENMHHSIDGQEERRMLLYLHNLEAEERTEFIEKLAERVLLQQGAQVPEERNFQNIIDTEQELSQRAVYPEEKNLRKTDVSKEDLSYRIADTKEGTAKIFGYTGEQIEGLLSYVSYVVENKKKAGEMISRVNGVAERRTEEVQVTEENYATELAEKDAVALFLQITSEIEKKNHSVDGQEERGMLLYLHNLEAEKRTEFIEKLAERVLLQQGAHEAEERNFREIVDTEEKLSYRTVDTEERNLREIGVIKEELSYRTVDTEEEAARIFGYTGEQIERLLSYVAYVIENKKKAVEMVSRVSEVAERRTEETYETGEVQATEEIYETGEVQATEEIYASELADREAIELYLQLSSVIEKKGQIRLQRSIAGGQDIQPSVSAPYEKLWEWGKALLFHPEQGDLPVEADLLPAWKDKVVSGGGIPGHNLLSLESGDKEEIQTEVIRRQIEAAKERNTLLQLIEQINHRIDFVQEEEKEGLEPGEKLVYADSQLNQPQVKSLLHFIKDLDEGQYGKLVEELSEITKLQWKMHSQGAEEIGTMQAEGSVVEQKDVDGEQPKFTWAPGSLGRQYMAIAYPALVYRIEEFEKYRQREVRGKIQSLGRMYLQQSGYLPREAAVLVSGLLSGEESIRVGKQLPGEEPLGVRDLLSGEEPLGVGNLLPGEESIHVGNLLPGEESDNIWIKEGRMLDLQYNMPSSTVSEEEQQQERVRMREESAQLKLAQEQISQKLKEVEVQLQKVETSARAKEDVRAFAEQVKSQLYEELHVEKLRRGLI